MTMPTSGQSRNSSSSSISRKMRSVRSLKAYCSMSKLTNARCARGRAQDRPQPVAHGRGSCPSGSIGSNWL